MSLPYIIVTMFFIIDDDSTENMKVFFLAMIPIVLMSLSISAITGAVNVKKDTTIKTFLAAPVSQSNVLLAKFIYVEVATVILSIMSLGVCTFMSVYKLNTQFSLSLKIVAIIFGIRLIVSAVEVPLFHLFNKQIVNTILLGLVISVISAIFIICMFYDMDKIVKFLMGIMDFVKKINSNNYYMPMFIVLIGMCFTALSYFICSKVRIEVN